MSHRTFFVRALIGVVALGVVAAGCASGDPTPAAVSEAESRPRLTPTDEAELSAQALANVCEQSCDTRTVYIHSSLFAATTRDGNETPMPSETIAAIRERFPDAVFVTMEEANALFGENALVDGGLGVLLSVGPVKFLRDDVVGIEVASVAARDGGHGRIEQFLWDGSVWEPADSSVTGVTTTSWVS